MFNRSMLLALVVVVARFVVADDGLGIGSVGAAGILLILSLIADLGGGISAVGTSAKSLNTAQPRNQKPSSSARIIVRRL